MNAKFRAYINYGYTEKEFEEWMGGYELSQYNTQ